MQYSWALLLEDLLSGAKRNNMKVYILSKGSNPWHNGRLIYAEAVRQGKDAELGFIEWPFTHILRTVQKSRPDWIFITGVSAFSVDQVKQFAKIAKVAIWDADAIHAIRDSRWKALSGIPSVVFSVVSNMVERYPTLSPNSIWTPQYYDDVTYAASVERPSKDEDFLYDVCFFGNLDAKRSEWLTRLTDAGIVVGMSSNIYGEKMANGYRQSRIAIAIWRDGYSSVGKFTVSDRIYKAMGCGAFYLLHQVGDLDSMFKDNVHLAIYDNTYVSLKAQIDYYLQNPEERERIAKVGQTEILDKHTLKVRINQYWNTMENAKL